MGKKIVVLQPMYLPWSGVFEQIRLCDIFVHFDDVLMPQGRSFINRIQVKCPQGQKWLTVPIVHSTRHGLIKDVRVAEYLGWREKHFETFRHFLSKAPFYTTAAELLQEIYSYKTDNLSSFNINAIEIISSYLGFKRQFLRSSELQTNGSSSVKLLNIVKKLGGDVYITGHGAKNYLDHDLFEKEGIEVRYMDYKILPYPQFYGEFTPYVSIIDMIAHNGAESVKFLNSQTVNWKNFIYGR